MAAKHADGADAELPARLAQARDAVEGSFARLEDVKGRHATIMLLVWAATQRVEPASIVTEGYLSARDRPAPATPIVPVAP